MEILEMTDPERKKLLNKVNDKKHDLEVVASALTGNTKKVLLNGLVITGALVVTFFVVRSISASKSKKDKKEGSPLKDQPEEQSKNEASFISGLGDRIVEAAVIFLLGLAKERLSEYLESRKNKNENPQ